jgi:hypothetical protein
MAHWLIEALAASPYRWSFSGLSLCIGTCAASTRTGGVSHWYWNGCCYSC